MNNVAQKRFCSDFLFHSKVVFWRMVKKIDVPKNEVTNESLSAHARRIVGWQLLLPECNELMWMK